MKHLALFALFALALTPMHAVGQDAAPAPTKMAENVRIDFKAIPLEGDDQGVYVLSAGGDFHVSVRFEGDEGGASFSVGGEAIPQPDGALLLTFDANLLWKGNEGAAEMSAAATVRIKTGQELAVARLGEKILVVSVSLPATE